MKKLLLTICVLLIATQCWGAELLVRASDSWGTLESRSRKGDIICVYPDGACKEPVAPDSKFIIVKIPDLQYKDALKYTEPLYDKTDPEKPVMLKVRKYGIESASVDSYVQETGKVKEISSATLATKLTTKTK